MTSKRRILAVAVLGLAVVAGLVLLWRSPFRQLTRAGVEEVSENLLLFDWRSVDRERLAEPISRVRTFEEARIQHADDDIAPVLQALTTSDRLDLISLQKSTIGQSTAHVLRQFDKITVLRLDGTQGKDWSFLGELANVEQLILNYGNFSDEGAAFLPQMYRLQELELRRSHVSDLATPHFVKCKQLKHLDLMYTGITDLSVPHLIQCKQLKYLGIQRTNITSEGYARLKAELRDTECPSVWPAHLEP